MSALSIKQTRDYLATENLKHVRINTAYLADNRINLKISAPTDFMITADIRGPAIICEYPLTLTFNSPQNAQTAHAEIKPMIKAGISISNKQLECA